MARNEWYSPAEVVEPARRVMGGIDLDPASCPAANEVVRAVDFYTIRDDGLKQRWRGRVWLNPPYDRFAPKFIAKFEQSFSLGEVSAGCLLLGVHHITTKWFGCLLSLDPIFCLPNRRLQFSGVTAQPMHGSVILGIGVEKEKFEEEFRSFGAILASPTVG